MNEDITERQDTPARTIEVSVFGDTADEIELAALDQARAFFGSDRQLEVVRDYNASGVVAAFPSHAATGKKYRARVRVRATDTAHRVREILDS